MPTRAQVEKSVVTCIEIANNDVHGYSNVVGDNNGSNGDYDCGGLVSKGLQEAGIISAGVMFEPNERYGNSWSYGTVLEPAGYTRMPFDYNNVKRGDILIKDGHHTEMAIGNYQQVGAHDNYDGVRGDYNHMGEISVVALSQNYWDYMYRPTITDEAYTSKHEVVANYINGKTDAQIEKAFKPVFNATYYYNKYTSSLKSVGKDRHDLLQHFLNDGMAGNMQGAATFDCTYYEQGYEDLQRSFGKNWPNYYIHYLQYGKKEGRDAYLCKDVPADYKYFTQIKYCIDKGLMTRKQKFGIKNHITRLALALIIYRLAGKPSIKVGDLPYTDIKDLTTCQKKALQYCRDNNIIKGYKDGTFRPSKFLTKRAIAIYLYRYNGKPEVSGTIPYKDIVDKKGSVGYNAILWCINKRVMRGANGSWKPKSSVTKTYMCRALYNMLGGK